MPTEEIMLRSPIAAMNADGVLARHFTDWCVKFKIFVTESGFETETGHTVYPAHAITESDGTVWLSALASFEQSGIRAHVEENQSFRDMLTTVAASPDRAPDGLALLIAGTPYQLIFQNTKAAGGNHIVNVAFINRGSLQATEE